MQGSDSLAEVRVPRKRPPSGDIAEKQKRQFSTSDQQPRSTLSRLENLKLLELANEDIHKSLDRLRELLRPTAFNIEVLEAYTIQILVLSFKVVTEAEYLAWTPKIPRHQLDKAKVLEYLPRPDRVVKFADLRISAQGYFDVTFPVTPMTKFSEFIYSKLTELGILTADGTASDETAERRRGSVSRSPARRPSNWKPRSKEERSVNEKRGSWTGRRKQSPQPAWPEKRRRRDSGTIEWQPPGANSSYSRRIGDVEETGYKGVGVKRVRLEKDAYLATFELDDDDLSSGSEGDHHKSVMSIKRVSFSAASFGSLEAAKAAADVFVFKFDKGIQTEIGAEAAGNKGAKPVARKSEVVVGGVSTTQWRSQTYWNALGHCSSCSCTSASDSHPMHCRTCVCNKDKAPASRSRAIRNGPNLFAKSFQKAPLRIANWDAWFDRLIDVKESDC